MGEAIRKTRLVGPAPSIQLRRPDGSSARTIALAPEVFALQPNIAVMHQVVNAQLAAARSGTQSTKTRAEVEGGGAKPWRQKGTGRARAGSTRAPTFVGGGVAHGPKPRSYKQKTPKKMVQLALRSALSDRAAEGKVIVVESWGFSTPKTKDAKAALGAMGVVGSALVVLGLEDESTMLSLRNLPNVHVVPTAELNTFDVLRHDFIVFTESTLPGAEISTEVETPLSAPTPVVVETVSQEGASE